jgi:hypothetical protein
MRRSATAQFLPRRLLALISWAEAVTIRTMRACFVLALSLILPGTPSAQGQADAQSDQVPAGRVAPSPASGDSICLMIESAARANDLPVDYFARVIWQESRFQPDVVGPRTRNGQRAQGIAQFMPGTAAYEGRPASVQEKACIRPAGAANTPPSRATYAVVLIAPRTACHTLHGTADSDSRVARIFISLTRPETSNRASATCCAPQRRPSLGCIESTRD